MQNVSRFLFKMCKILGWPNTIQANVREKYNLEVCQTSRGWQERPLPLTV